MQVQRTFKRREGVWGIVKGDKGGASQVVPLSPLTKLTTFGIAKRCFANAQHDKIPCVIASERRERGNQPFMNTRHVCLSNTVDCFAYARNDKEERSPPPTGTAPAGAYKSTNAPARDVNLPCTNRDSSAKGFRMTIHTKQYDSLPLLPKNHANQGRRYAKILVMSVTPVTPASLITRSAVLAPLPPLPTITYVSPPCSNPTALSSSMLFTAT